MRNNRVYILLIALGIASIVMMWDSSENVITPPKSAPAPQIPYAFAEDASTEYFGDAGVLEYSFTADRLEHFRKESDDSAIPPEEYTLVNSPHFVVYQEHTPWHIESQEGKLTRADEQILLWNQVRIWQEVPDSDNPDEPLATHPDNSELSTEKLFINPVEKVAHTEEPVKITTPYGKITAVGMSADFKSRKIQLESRVHAIHRIPEDRSFNP